jgi:putative FmdB family regulatory protein
MQCALLYLYLYVTHSFAASLPLYTYKCPPCDHTFDVLAKMSESSKEQECPNCNAPAQRQLTAPLGFQFKGGGYYCTDFK